MQYQVFVQNPAEQKFVASIIGMPAVSEEGVTEEEAIYKAKAALEAQLATGKLVTIELPQTASAKLTMELDPTAKSHSSIFPMQYAGIFADDPTFEDWTQKLALIRQEANSAED